MSTHSSIYGTSDNIYLNLSITNNLTSAGGGTFSETPIPASLSVNKTIAIIDKPSDFYLSVVRFSVPLNAIPLMIAPIVPNQGNANLTPLKVSIFYGGFNTTQVIYVPQNNATAPLQNLPTQLVTPYYYIYSYDQWISDVNTALTASWVASGLAALFPTIPGPYFYYNPMTQLISITVPNCFVVLTAPAISIPILYVNQQVLKYFDTFNVMFNGFNQVNGNDFSFIFANATQDNVLNANQYRFTQDFQSVSSWTNLNTLIISSPTLPIVQESVPANNVGSNASNNTVTNSFPILTDFIPNIELPGQSRSIAYYYPPGQYRLVDMVTDIPVSAITINLYWTDISGNIYPLMLNVGQSVNIKIAFLRKSLYKQNTNKLLLYN